MLSRISEALGCPRSKGDSSNSTVPDDPSWLSQSVQHHFFSLPTPVLQEILQTMCISRCHESNQFFFDVLSPDYHVQDNDKNRTPWSVVHTSRLRYNAAEQLLKEVDYKRDALIQELRALSAHSTENFDSTFSTFIDLLTPLMTDKSPNSSDIPEDDVLILFGVPASIFQLLLCVPSISSQLTDLILELVACSSVHSQRLLQQFRQPVGLNTMFNSKHTFQDTATRMLQLFQVVPDSDVQALILTILPDLASSPSNSASSDEDRNALFLQLLDLLPTVQSQPPTSYAEGPDPTNCLIECLTTFSTDTALLTQLQDACLGLLNRCYGEQTFHTYLPTIIRCLIIDAPTSTREPTALSLFAKRLRACFSFPKNLTNLSLKASIERNLVQLLRLTFQFNKNFMNEWMRSINTSTITESSPSENDLKLFHYQAVQDFLVLCVIYSVADANVSGSKNLSQVTKTSCFMLQGSSSEATQLTRLQKEAVVLLRRLVLNGRLFPESLQHGLVKEFFTRHGYLLMSEENCLFTPFLHFIDYVLITTRFGASAPTASIRGLCLLLYVHSFCASSCTTIQRQEIVIRLARHGLSGLHSSTSRGTACLMKSNVVAEAGLTALLCLTQREPQKLVKFESTLFNLLEHLVQFAISLSSESSEASTRISSEFSSLSQRVRRTFLILSWVAFCSREHKPVQEKLLGFIRAKLSSSCSTAKALSLLGSVIVLETICRSRFPDLLCTSKRHACPASTQLEDSVVLASQLSHVDVDRTSVSATSRSNSISCLSLRGPGTSLADDPAEVQLVSEVTDDESPSSLDKSRAITPPSRLLLQIIGLAERAIAPWPQLKCVFLGELHSSFCRLSQWINICDQSTSLGDGSDGSDSKWLFDSPSSDQALRLLRWMGARVMRDFQDYFVFDNSPFDEYVTELNLNDPTMCEISVGIGPSWNRYRSELLNRGPQLRTSPGESSNATAPLLAPSLLTLLATVESTKRRGKLDALDALLGCPILLRVVDPGELVIHERFLRLGPSPDEPQLLLFIINWMIEAVNVFAPYLMAHQEVDAAVSSTSAERFSTGYRARKLHRSVALDRLQQLVRLRQQLFNCLVEMSQRDRKLASVVQNNDIMGFTKLSNICIPTAFYEPGKAYNTHPSTGLSTASASGLSCFACGIHLSCSAPKEGATGNQKGLANVSKSKCAASKRTTTSSSKRATTAGSTGRRGQKTTKRRKTHSLEDDNDEDNLSIPVDDELSSLSSGSHSEAARESDDDEGSGLQDTIGEELQDKVGSSKWVAGKHKRGKITGPVSPNLMELCSCFRELDISSLALGLVSWPWSLSAEARNINQDPCELSWQTLLWLLEDATSKLEHVSHIRPVSHPGWFAFARLDNLKPTVRSNCFLYVASCLPRILQKAVDYMRGDHSVGGELNCRSSTSDEVPPDPHPSNCLATSTCKEPCEKTGRSVDPDVDLGVVVSNCLCTCLHLLWLLCGGSNSQNAVVVVVPKYTASQSTEPFTLDHLSEQSIHRLASSCKHPADQAQSCNLYKGGAMFMDPIEDLSLEHEAFADSPKDPSLLSASLHTLMDWLLTIAPSGLPHVTAAFLHCRLMYQLTETYIHSVVSSRGAFSEDTWLPDLFSYSKSLLQIEWDPTVRWRGHTFRDSLQGLLSMHLRICPNFTKSVRSNTNILSPTFLLDFTRGLILPTVRRYHGRQPGDREQAVSVPWNEYKALSEQTVDVFCREVMNSVLWMTKQLCSAETSADARDEDNECLLLSNWNECVVILGLLVNVLQLSRRNSDRGREVADSNQNTRIMTNFLPSMMRTCRLFLQSLLKAAMPVLNSLFRQRGVEVVTFLKNVQTLTRFLQRVCTHAKAHRESQLTNQIPTTRRCLETFVYRVKVMLSQHRCAEAFWLGTLKNRDLHGMEVPDDLADSHELSQTICSSNAIAPPPRPAARRSRSQSLPGEYLGTTPQSELDSESECGVDDESVVARVEPANLDEEEEEEEEEEEVCDAGEDESDSDGDLIEPSDTEPY